MTLSNHLNSNIKKYRGNIDSIINTTGKKALLIFYLISFFFISLFQESSILIFLIFLCAIYSLLAIWVMYRGKLPNFVIILTKFKNLSIKLKIMILILGFFPILMTTFYILILSIMIPLFGSLIWIIIQSIAYLLILNPVIRKISEKLPERLKINSFRILFTLSILVIIICILGINLIRKYEIETKIVIEFIEIEPGFINGILLGILLLSVFILVYGYGINKSELPDLMKMRIQLPIAYILALIVLLIISIKSIITLGVTSPDIKLLITPFDVIVSFIAVLIALLKILQRVDKRSDNFQEEQKKGLKRLFPTRPINNYSIILLLYAISLSSKLLNTTSDPFSVVLISLIASPIAFILLIRELRKENKKLLKVTELQLYEHISVKNRTTALFICYFLGILGVHRFYVGKNRSGLIYLISAGGFMFGWLYDLINIFRGNFTDNNGKQIIDW